MHQNRKQSLEQPRSFAHMWEYHQNRTHRFSSPIGWVEPTGFRNQTYMIATFFPQHQSQIVLVTPIVADHLIRSQIAWVEFIHQTFQPQSSQI